MICYLICNKQYNLVTMQLSAVVSYANTDSTTQESVNVLPKNIIMLKYGRSHA